MSGDTNSEPRATRLIRRCAILVIEPRESLQLDPRGLLSGGMAIRASVATVALAPHLDEPVGIDDAALALLTRVGESIWQTRDALLETFDAATIDALLANGLLIGDGDAESDLRERDAKIRDTYWSALPAVAHAFGRWRESGVEDDVRITPHRTLADLIREYGPPPPHATLRDDAVERIALPTPPRSSHDDVLECRTTCRNFDTATPLPLDAFSFVVRRAVGALADVDVLPGVKALKKNHPSGGALHPLEAHLVVRHVDGIAPGTFHYDVIAHALERLPASAAADLDAFALRSVANQTFFADAHAMLILSARFRRTFWKYRNHPKAYRAIVLEAGHVSQNLYIAATELGLGAFVTAAINEIDIERALGIDPLEQGVIAVCGFGIRAEMKATAEFDPLEKTWRDERRVDRE